MFSGKNKLECESTSKQRYLYRFRRTTSRPLKIKAITMITGNTQVDYTLVILFSLIKTSTLKLLTLLQSLFINYPDVALVSLIVIGSFLMYYLILNAVRIVYNLVVNMIKLTLILSILILISWIYLRGFITFQNDMRLVVDYTSKLDPNSTISQIKEFMVSITGFLDI